jgi:hypothetical protein
MDQAYVQQILPPVSAFSIAKLVKRRLERDFPGDNIKGSIIVGRDKEGRKDWTVMLVALQQSAAVRGWTSVASDWPTRCAGLYLLPVEASGLMSRLQAALAEQDKEAEQATWQFLVSYNKISGVRQVVFRDGKIVLTRLGQPAVDSKPETIAGTIEQEIVGTKEYLKRMAYQDKDSLSIIVIAAEDIRKCIDVVRLQATSTHLITPHEAAMALHLEGATQPTDRFGDALLGAAIGTESSCIRRICSGSTSLRWR